MTTDRVADFASIFGVPPAVGAVVHEFRSCEFSTIARDGTPVTWPTMPFFEPAHRRFLITASIGLAQKVFNVRRDGRVAMLFSNPTGSGLVSPPLVLIQGDANAPEDLTPLEEGFVERAQLLFERQPVGITMIAVMPGPVRRLADWYGWRVFIHVRPRRIRWWPEGDPERPFVEVIV
ncbi:MAG: pyridoxamine 5'-phosphate oxidase family protein [Chloroflexota bacterium]|nr:pyridoxamine 5'-phosphate oxidase family protein [Chloroflexota bacterium]